MAWKQRITSTSLIAAQNSGRQMHSMELAPKYCGMALERFRRKISRSRNNTPADREITN